MQPQASSVLAVPVYWPHPLPVACARSIFLIDHAWTCRVGHARQQLQQVPGLLHRMANLMGIEFHGELPSAEAVEQVLEEMWKFNQTYQLSHGVSGQPGPGEVEDRHGAWPSLPRAARASRPARRPLTARDLSPQWSKLLLPWPIEPPSCPVASSWACHPLPWASQCQGPSCLHGL